MILIIDQNDCILLVNSKINRKIHNLKVIIDGTIKKYYYYNTLFCAVNNNLKTYAVDPSFQTNSIIYLCEMYSRIYQKLGYQQQKMQKVLFCWWLRYLDDTSTTRDILTLRNFERERIYRAKSKKDILTKIANLEYANKYSGTNYRILDWGQDGN